MNRGMKMALMYGGETRNSRNPQEWEEMRVGNYESTGRRRMEYGGANDRYGSYNTYDGGGEMRGRVGFESHYQDARQEGRPKGEPMHGKVIPMHEREEEDALSMQEAKEWVDSMEGSGKDSFEGGRWELHEAKEYAEKVGIPTDEPVFVEFWAVMNAMYSDYADVAREFGVHRPEFYAAMAKAWLCDMDAVDDKAKAYYKHVVKHGK